MFSSIKPPSDSDNESSDGDYVPGDDEEDDEDDGFFDSDFMDTESAFDDMDVEEELDDVEMEGEEVSMDAWEGVAADASMENWGLSSEGDVESEELSEVEILALNEALFGTPQADGESQASLSSVSLFMTFYSDVQVYSDVGECSGVLRAPQNDAAEPK